MYPFPILISAHPGAWPIAMAARHQTCELALRLFISLHRAYLSSARHRHHGPTTPMAATVQTCLNEMKRNFGIASVLLLLAVAAVYVGMWLHGRKSARPLHGNFDVSMRCACGHDIFLELDSGTAYDHSPGHHDRKAIGTVVRTADSAVIVDARDGRPWMRLEWDGSAHSLSFLKNPDSKSMMGMIPVRGRIEQVTNPWRTELPKYLPEN